MRQFFVFPIVISLVFVFFIAAEASDKLILKQEFMRAYALKTVSFATIYLEDGKYKKAIYEFNQLIYKYERMLRSGKEEDFDISDFSRLSSQEDALFFSLAATSGERTLKELYFKALIGKFHALNSLEQYEKSLEPLDKIIVDDNATASSYIAIIYTDALMYRASRLGSLGKYEDAFNLYHYMIVTLGDIEQEYVIKIVANAYQGHGIYRLFKLKKAVSEGSAVLTEQEISNSIVDLSKSLKITPDDVVSLTSLGYATFLLEMKKGAEEILLKAFEIDPVGTFGLAYDISRVHPIPEDKEFLKLIDKLYAETDPEKAQ